MLPGCKRMPHPPASPNRFYCMYDSMSHLKGLLHDAVFLFVNMNLSVGSERFDLALFRLFTELIFLQYTQGLFHRTRGLNVNTASAHST